VTKQLTKLIPYYSIFVKQLKTARPRTPSPQWPQIDSVLGNAVSSAFKGEPVQQALDSAAKQIDALLAG
jgi:multiple sugar transport system substrate-binding protein